MALLTLVVAPWGAAAQSYPAARAADTPAHGGVLTQGFKNDLATLDPAIGYDWNNWPAEKMVFDALLDYNEGTTIVPRIAARLPTISNGGRRYTFTLRRGVRF